MCLGGSHAKLETIETRDPKYVYDRRGQYFQNQRNVDFSALNRTRASRAERRHDDSN
ncbi:hypothetical protein AGR6A_Lc140071 [Agrobacterium sp. NCPPB 925]|nr:hypothetical protein AGR6A_Lc140071 [Agrobacterium sp. NCPPB 925]